ncbi:FG-nucleoporin NUP60 LALA0_S04e00606g [Lachancea lanzarotensis]|uniref:LALA0S04e00606g1_1 n=1 Tax=Lachancea lanzarotensis TaxID=1245769 RepID=A0A0C7MPG4_9SACH|nr:uncharacterized protein LALA0_S04e00606g [Lachancea lanzarotensis]CEP61784.1 LALA0S04e00606g1_1 [Lachancea lanzarotensis]
MQNKRQDIFGKGPQAPYSRILKKQDRGKRTFLSKVKSFFASGNPDSVNSLKLVRVPEFQGVSAPGGFYDRPPNNLISTKERSISKGPEAIEEDPGAATLEEVNSSNSTLAQFFRQKGDEALSEVEYEGVLSLMRKIRSGPTENLPSSEVTSEVSCIQAEPSSILKANAGPHEISLKTPQFHPKYDNYSTTANTSLKSISSTGTTRSRVFDYAGLPSPYKTSSYRHGASHLSAVTKKNKTNVDSAPAPEAHTQEKLSNTASALLSLLDSGEVKPKASGLANPYANRVSEFKKFRKSVEPSISAPDTPSKNGASAVQSLALSEIRNTEDTECDKGDKTSAAQHFTKYKPAKASTLRTTVSAPKVPQNKAGSVPKQSDDSPSVHPYSGAFNFTYSTTAPALGRESSTTSQKDTREAKKPFGDGTDEGFQSKPSHAQREQESPSEHQGLKRGDEEASLNLTASQLNHSPNTSRNDDSESLSHPHSKAEQPRHFFEFFPPPSSGLKREWINRDLVKSWKNTFAF